MVADCIMQRMKNGMATFINSGSVVPKLPKVIEPWWFPYIIIFSDSEMTFLYCKGRKVYHNH